MSEQQDLVALTADIVASYVEGNKIAIDDLADLIRQVRAALAKPEDAPPAETPGPKLTPAQIRKSITPAGLISFEDGRAYQTLKRHLGTRGLTVEQYRAKWGLPKDYPTTAPVRRAPLRAGQGRRPRRQGPDQQGHDAGQGPQDQEVLAQDLRS